MLNYILKKITRIVVRIILLLFMLGFLLASMLYISYQNSITYPHPDQVFDFIEQNKSEVYLNQKNRAYLSHENIWAIRLDQDGNVIESFNKPEEVKNAFEITDIARFTRYYLNDYPVFTYVAGDGLMVFAYPKDSFDKLPSNFYNYNNFIFNLKLALSFLVIFLLLVFLMYKVDIRNIFKMLDPIQKAIDHLYEDDYDKLEEVGELAELSQAINDANQKYHNLKEAQAKWIRGISHDIRTPLAKISWGLDAVKEDQNLAEINKMQSQVLKISHIIEDLNLTMSISSINKNKFTLQNPVPILRNLIVEKLNENPSREIVFDNKLEDVKLNIDPNLFYRMLENILKNSLTYTAGKIKVSAYSQETNVFITIEDEGKGIPEELIRKVQNSDLDHIATHGLGLFISKQLSEVQGGSFLIENTYPGVKHSFIFTVANEIDG